MQAVEFDTVVDGHTIHITKEYSELEHKNVKVIIMLDSPQKIRGRRTPGSAKGKIFVADDFDQPLDEETTEQFYQ